MKIPQIIKVRNERIHIIRQRRLVTPDKQRNFSTVSIIYHSTRAFKSPKSNDPEGDDT